MAAPVVPYARVAPPARGAPTRYGLFSASTVLEGTTGHELGGIDYETVCSTQTDGFPAPCRDLPAQTKAGGDTLGYVAANPFVVYAADECALGRDMATAIAQLRTRFEVGEQATVERIIQNGELGASPSLVAGSPQAATTIVADPGDPAGGLDLATSIGLLEQWLAAEYGGIGVIHVPRWMSELVKKQVDLAASGPRMVTAMGTTIAFGTGYTGPPPTGQTDKSHVWLYATPPVTVRRSPIMQPADWTTGAFDRHQNLGFLLDERVYVVDWPCGTAAVHTNVAIPKPYTPPASGQGHLTSGRLPDDDGPNTTSSITEVTE